MTAIRSQIFAAVLAALQHPDVGAQEVALMPAGDPDQYPALHIHDLGDDPEMGEAGADFFRLGIGLDGFVSEGSGAAAHEAANALHARAVKAIYASADLAAISHEIEAGRLDMTTATRAGAPRLAFSRDLFIHYSTRRGDPAEI